MEEVRDVDVVGLYDMALREVDRLTEQPQKIPCAAHGQTKQQNLGDNTQKIYD
jgi:hypothetical protein